MTTVNENGLTISTYAESLAQVAAALKASFGSSARSDDPESVMGAIVLPFCAVIAEINQGLQDAATSHSISAGEGTIADVGELNGVSRIAAQNSTVTLTVTAKAAAGCTIPVGSEISTNATSTVIWKTDSAITLAAGASGSVTATCQTAGAIAANIGTLTFIRTPVYGWASVTNPAVATVGWSRESIGAFRVRQLQAAKRRGSCTVQTIQRAILDPAQGAATAATVRENNGVVADADGIPAGGIWAVVTGGTDEDVARAILDSREAGTGMKGSTSVDVYYSDIDKTLTANFDRPTQVFVEVRVRIASKTPEFTTINNQSLTNNIIAYVNDKGAGETLRANELYGLCYAFEGLVISQIYVREYGTPHWTSAVSPGSIEILKTQEGYIYFEQIA